MNTEEAIELMSQTISEADARIVLKIVKKAIEEMKLEPVMSDEEFAALSPDEKTKELLTARFCSFKFSEEVEGIFIRFVGDETPLANVLFFPIEATCSFLETARNYYNTPETTLTHEEIENLAFIKSLQMILIMMRNLYPRVMATMRSITDETINEWYRQQNEDYREYCSRRGIIVPSNESNVKKVRQKIIKEHGNEVQNIWEGEKKRFENYQKTRFAEEYQKLYSHWDTISLLYRNKKDFLGYAKMKGFEDTPDDLLEELKGSHHRGVSLKALEHAARRVNLINPDCEDEKILEKRRSGIQASGFSETTLHKYNDEGKKIIENFKSQQITPPKAKQLTE